MKHLISAALLWLLAFSAFAQNATNPLNLNGMAAFEQLRKEYYIGALYLGWPGHDPQTIANMPGKKRMELHVTADRWPPLRFAQQWNQLILINNDSHTLNANVMDLLAFTNIPKSDLVAGDRLAIDLEPDVGTVVRLNGTVVVRTTSPVLFNMLLNVWIGHRPPTSEFKRDMLSLPKDQAAAELAARYDETKPSAARTKAVVAWAGKVPQDEPAAAPAPEPQAAKPVETVAVKAEAEVKPKGEHKAEPKPKPESKPAAKPEPKAAVAAAKPAAAKKPEQPNAAELAQAEAARQAKAKQEAQQGLYNQYLVQVRQLVNRKTEYPRRAAKENIEGLVVLRVELDRSGKLLNMDLAQSAHDWLDHAAEKAVRRAAPFPPVSAQLEGNQFQFLVPIVFKLTE